MQLLKTVFLKPPPTPTKSLEGLLKRAGGALLGDSGKRKKKRKGEGREGGKRKERKREREERRRTVFVPSYAFKGASGCD